MTDATRLLIFTPTYDYPNGQPAMAPECEVSIRTQQIAADWEWHIGHLNPFPGGDHRNVLAQYQQARQMTLEGGYDALLTVEHDNVLPDDNAVQRLLDTPGDAIYAPYVLRHGVHVLSTWRYQGNLNIGESLTLHQDELAAAREAVVYRVSGVGMGCTLFRRTALESIPFRKGEGNSYAPDIPFAQDALHLGLISNARMDVPVLHRQNEDWLHPYMTIGLKKYFCRVNVNALAADGERFTLVQGQYVEMLPSQAIDLVRAGFITIFDEYMLAAKAEAEMATAEPDGERAVPPRPKRLLEVVTRAFRRPTMLAANKASVAGQAGGDLAHTVLVDSQGVGVPAANARLAAFEPAGDYVWLLDDDDVCIYPHLVTDLARIALRYHNPPAVIVRMDHGDLGILPADADWGCTLHEAGIGASGIVTRRDVWMECRDRWASGRYESDWDFIAAVWAAHGPQIVWHDIVASRVQRISRGQPEAA